MERVGLLVAEPLRFLLLPSLRTAAGGEGVALGWDGAATWGHLVQAAGVPLTEVGLLLVDGVPVSPSDRPRSGAVLEVATVPRPQPVPQPPARFLLDVHLGALARRLRVLGVDAAYRNDAGDDDLVARAHGEARVLLTQDRGLLRRRALWADGRWGAFVRGASPDDQLDDVLDRFAPALAPSARCPRCNGLLTEVAKADVADRLQPGTLRSYDDFRRCTGCGRVYWRGAHAHRLDDVVARARRTT